MTLYAKLTNGFKAVSQVNEGKNDGYTPPGTVKEAVMDGLHVEFFDDVKMFYPGYSLKDITQDIETGLTIIDLSIGKQAQRVMQAKNPELNISSH